MKANVIHDMEICDYVIKPQEIVETKLFDLKALNRNINIGYEATCRILSEISRSGSVK